jgi:hypothetical protein
MTAILICTYNLLNIPTLTIRLSMHYYKIAMLEIG